MSHITDQLHHVDEKKASLITQALEKKQREAFSNPREQADGKKRGASIGPIIFIILSAIILTMGFVMMYWAGDKMVMMDRKQEQLAVLLEEHLEEYAVFEEHVRAMEAEFRRAFKKDRDQLQEISSALEQLSSQVSESISQVHDAVDKLSSFQSGRADLEKQMAELINKDTEVMGRMDRLQDKMQENISTLQMRVEQMSAQEQELLTGN